MNHRSPRRLKFRTALAALLAAVATSFSTAPLSAAPLPESSPQKVDNSFTLLVAYRGDDGNTGYSWWTPVRNYQTNRAWLGALQPKMTDRSKELKVAGIFASPARRPAGLKQDALYRVSGVMTTPKQCSKPIARKACKSPVVMSLKSITPVTGACAQHEYYGAYTYVCGTSTEIVGITSDPSETSAESIHIEGRTLQVRARGFYPQPIGGRIDTSLATGFITLPPHPKGVCSVSVLVYHFLDGSKYDLELSTLNLSYPC